MTAPRAAAPSRKPHRIAFLVPTLSVPDGDVARARDLELLLWLACIDAASRHPQLAVLDAEAMQVQAQGPHFVPALAQRGATPDDAALAASRRDEVVWLELSLQPGKPGAVRLHTIDRAGVRESFDALGGRVGAPVHLVVSAWLAERGLAPTEPWWPGLTVEGVLAAGRALSRHVAVLAELRPWLATFTNAQLVSFTPGGDGGGDGGDAATPDRGARPGGFDVATATAELAAQAAPLRVAALHALALASRAAPETLLAEVAPDHPRVQLAAYLAAPADARDRALLRAVIAAAPGWAAPYRELEADDADAAVAAADRVSPLEAVAAAGLVTLCRPDDRDGTGVTVTRLAAAGDVDGALRLARRRVALHDDDSQVHLDLLDVLRRAERPGAWLAQAHASGWRHGCPMAPHLPWYPDQILIDLAASTAYLEVGRLDEATALRGNRLEGREGAWPRHTKILQRWRREARLVAWCYAREGYFRGDDARAVEGFGRIEPGDGVDVAIFLDALVALGREHEAPLAWAQYGEGRGFATPWSRLAAARALMIAGAWRRGVEQLWQVALRWPRRDDHAAIARTAALLAEAPLAELEAALAARLDAGAVTLARRLARDVADFAPAAATSAVVTRALGSTVAVGFEPAWLAGFAATTRSRAAVDALFAEVTVGGHAAGHGDARQLGELLVARWLQVVFVEASEDDAAALAQAAAYVAAQALSRYLAATTATPSPLTGALRTVAAEALALVHRHRAELADGDARALLAAIEPLVGRVDGELVDAWLDHVERALDLDGKSRGDLAGFAAATPAVAARLVGPEERALLGWHAAALRRAGGDGWAAAAEPLLARLAWHTGGDGAGPWAEAVEAMHAAGALGAADAIDRLATAAYLARGVDAGPCVAAARALFAAGAAEAALTILCDGLHAADEAERDRHLQTLAGPWQASGLDVPFGFQAAAGGVFEALQRGDGARAARLGRWALAMDPHNAEGHRNVGLALAIQGEVLDALTHLTRATPDQATQILSGTLYQTGRLPQALEVLDFASRWYVRADQWLTYGGVVYAAMDNPRTVKAYALAYQLDPDAFDASQLNAYAGVLDEVGDHATLERIAGDLIRIAGDDVMWLTNGWNHLACCYIGLGRFDEAVALAERAVAQNPLPDNTEAFAATLARARAHQQLEVPPLGPVGPARAPIFAQLEDGDLAGAAAQLDDPDWKVRGAALRAARFRFSSENRLEVTERARAAALRIVDAAVGVAGVDAALARAWALDVREQALFPRDPVPALGDRMTR
ncbi:MAG: tetratricopeptide repeat protein, partial [Kofleriaceae bacterium]|nr:tetratricopeptide repeat protein [Kofleriaceae bacterium]